MYIYVCIYLCIFVYMYVCVHIYCELEYSPWHNDRRHPVLGSHLSFCITWTCFCCCFHAKILLLWSNFCHNWLFSTLKVVVFFLFHPSVPFVCSVFVCIHWCSQCCPSDFSTLPLTMSQTTFESWPVTSQCLLFVRTQTKSLSSWGNDGRG